MKRRDKLLLIILISMVFGCSIYRISELDKNYGTASSVDRTVLKLSPENISFHDEVQPIIERRCDVCHSCYDAPCQLKMTSFEGLDRGGTKQLVYDAARILTADPTRLFIDAHSTAAWREKQFHPVLNERSQTPEANQKGSLIYQMLDLKRKHPLPETVILPDVFDLRLDHNYICPTIEEYSDYEKKYPLWGMPYALTGLTETEYNTLTDWVAQGALITPGPAISNKASATIDAWERFLNGSSAKEQLMSRYLYEHLFIAHIHFKELEDREFYMLVRSTTPPGLPVDEINTLRPYDDPGVDRFYYRLRRVESTIVVKNHTVYHMGPEKMARYRELFLGDDYSITKSPGYDPKTTANPFATFAEIPAKSRYHFLLDDAQFFVMGFIKGPVCRGQVALNVINDQFFVAFTDPETDPISNDTAFLAGASDLLRLPSEQKSNVNIITTWRRYRKLQQEYLAARSDYMTQLDREGTGRDLSHIWNGDGTNPNALLTIFRHFDSASVVKGFVGKIPKTAWIVDYPLLERIHYLLVAGFNVYGNVGHQAESRIHMDYLRMEGESNFLTYLPRESRSKLWDSLYENGREESKNFLSEQYRGLDRNTHIIYKTDDPKTEFIHMLLAHAGAATDTHDHLNRCSGSSCAFNTGDGPLTRKADLLMRRLGEIRGRQLQVIPDVGFVRITMNGQEDDVVYTLIRNKALSNNSLMFREDRRRKIDDDSLTIVRGYVGSYPNTFARISIENLESAIDEYINIWDMISYFEFALKYAIRRNSPDFWSESDWHYRRFLNQEPVDGGLFDMYRFHLISKNSEQTPMEW